MVATEDSFIVEHRHVFNTGCPTCKHERTRWAGLEANSIRRWRWSQMTTLRKRARSCGCPLGA